MHQLSKAPAMIGRARTSTSPKQDMTAFKMQAYLDYCTQMLSLAAKIAALYAQTACDAQTEEAASDTERRTTNLSQKIGDNITILRVGRDA